MPRFDGLAPFKKVDFLASFSLSNEEIRSVHDSVWVNTGGTTISQSSVRSYGQVSHYVAIETKTASASYHDAAIQLLTWTAAGIQKLKRLKDLADASTTRHQRTETLRPSIGISIIGYTWNMVVTTKLENGNVV